MITLPLASCVAFVAELAVVAEVAVVALSALVACLTLLFASAVLSTLPSPTAAFDSFAILFVTIDAPFTSWTSSTLPALASPVSSAAISWATSASAPSTFVDVNLLPASASVTCSAEVSGRTCIVLPAASITRFIFRFSVAIYIISY